MKFTILSASVLFCHLAYPTVTAGQGSQAFDTGSVDMFMAIPVEAPDPVIRAEDLPADQQPTPMLGIGAAVRAMDVRGKTVYDAGCGFDCRLGIHAANMGAARVIAVELDPVIADSARRYVAHAGLTGKIEVITGDVTKLRVPADVVYAYLHQDTMSRMMPILDPSVQRIVTYGFPVPELDMREQPVGNGASLYIWDRPPAYVQVPITERYRVGTQRIARGSYCQVCNGYCGNPMKHLYQQRIVGYKTVPNTQPTAAPAQAQPQYGYRYETRMVKICVNGRCRMVPQQVRVRYRIS